MAWTQKVIGDRCILDNVLLGKGAHGLVYKGHYKVDENQTIDVAIKQIDKREIEKLMEKDEQQAKQILKQCEREANIQSKLKNPYILELYEVKGTQNNYYYVMEFCPDGDLQNYLEKYSPVPKAQYLKIFLQICEAFKFLQSVGVCHRDLKPANILLKGDLIKLADFGFAKILEGNTNSVVYHTKIGTPLFMSPQIIQCDNYDPIKQDVWSAGILLYRMVYSKYPWNGKDFKELLQNIDTTPLSFPPHSPEENLIDDLLQNMLHKDEAKRFDWNQITAHPLVVNNKNLLK